MLFFEKSISLFSFSPFIKEQLDIFKQSPQLFSPKSDLTIRLLLSAISSILYITSLLSSFSYSINE